ncbi:MAG: glycoside hydrolase family 127 protein [Planctomycetia bacterium]|nr:glycoside hydrolase family 127 protein [Planctomycetia bacterium]
MKRAAILLTLLLASPGATASEGPTHRKLSAVPFTEVKLRDAFWAPRLATNRASSLPHNFLWCEQTGRLSNFDKAAGTVEGKFEGIFFNDSDVYKVLEGASYTLADHPDPVLEKTVDKVIASIAAAQQKDGYLNTYYTLVEPGKRFTDCRVKHELYCAGHLFEAAVAHYRATGKRTLLDVAVKYADLIDKTFGPGRRMDVPGHEEIELALVKLYQATGEKRYLDLARFFLDQRGNAAGHTLYGPYFQDHKPIREQDEIVGHAVRAMYLYCGVADVASYTGDQGFIGTMDRLWDDVVGRKMYVTGGIGARAEGEAFGDRYELPNASAYCETCAAIGMILWNHRLSLMCADAKYADVLERVLYNGFLSGVALDGKQFFYVNPLASDGKHHRQPFYPCACCPTNVIRVLPSLPGYVYAQDGKQIFVNLYIAGTGNVPLGDGVVAMTQETRYPWDGAVKLTVAPKAPAEFAVNLRIPAWCRGAKLAVNGTPVDKLDVDKGYARINRSWKPGDVIELALPMEPERIEAHPRVAADASRVAIQRGPIVYCFEGVDNNGAVHNIVLPHDPKFVAEDRPDLLGGVTCIKGVARDGRPITAVPYYAWDHREPGAMAVWVRQDGTSRTANPDDPAWQDKLYRPLDPATLGPSTPIPPAELSTASASHSTNGDLSVLAALNDQLEPKDSCDHTIPRFTWWDHRGTKEWVQYDFGSPQKVSAVEVYWFDDERVQRHCRAPKSWKLLYKDGDEWKPVAGAGEYATAIDRYNRVTFTPIETTALRIEAELSPPWSAGILEWKVE